MEAGRSLLTRYNERMNFPSSRWKGRFLLSSATILAIGLGAGIYLKTRHFRPGTSGSRWSSLLSSAPALTKESLASAMSGLGVNQELFPSEIELPIAGKPTRVGVQYAFDPELQVSMENLFRQYRPDY